jgi:uncharacterized lipoprotein NlpE involved in copper resistance
MKIILSIVFLILISCNNKPEEDTYKLSTFCTVKVIEIDSCEYLYAASPYGGVLTHKGNCKNCQGYK